jgi:hypothetical protein
VLLMPTSLPLLVCNAPATWLVGHPALVKRYPLLASAVEIARKGNTVLWRLPGRGSLSAADCPQRPSANSTGM